MTVVCLCVVCGGDVRNAVRAWQHDSSKARQGSLSCWSGSFTSVDSILVSSVVFHDVYVPVVVISRDEWSVWPRCLTIRVEYKNGFLLCPGRGCRTTCVSTLKGVFESLTGARRQQQGTSWVRVSR